MEHAAGQKFGIQFLVDNLNNIQYQEQSDKNHVHKHQKEVHYDKRSNISVLQVISVENTFT
jgi:hypothetical protein